MLVDNVVGAHVSRAMSIIIILASREQRREEVMSRIGPVDEVVQILGENMCYPLKYDYCRSRAMGREDDATFQVPVGVMFQPCIVTVGKRKRGSTTRPEVQVRTCTTLSTFVGSKNRSKNRAIFFLTGRREQEQDSAEDDNNSGSES